jgi:hypothetical protein
LIPIDGQAARSQNVTFQTGSEIYQTYRYSVGFHLLSAR